MVSTNTVSWLFLPLSPPSSAPQVLSHPTNSSWSISFNPWQVVFPSGISFLNFTPIYPIYYHTIPFGCLTNSQLHILRGELILLPFLVFPTLNGEHQISLSLLPLESVTKSYWLYPKNTSTILHYYYHCPGLGTNVSFWITTNAFESHLFQAWPSESISQHCDLHTCSSPTTPFHSTSLHIL